MDRFKKGFDEDSSDNEASSSGDQETEETEKGVTHASKKQKAGPQLEDLQELGFRTGPSVLTIKEQPPDLSYEWWVVSGVHYNSAKLICSKKKGFPFSLL